MDLEKEAADSKRIAEKMRETQQLAEQSKADNKSPAAGSVQGGQSNNDPENGRVLCGWREDEDDRFNVGDYVFTSYRQNPYCDQHPEKMKAIMKALFQADHDAAQLEQYELENNRLKQQLVINKPALTLKQVLYRGLRGGLVLILILGGQSTSVKAQTEIKALKIGDKVPDVTIQNIINYESTTAKISDFKGKLLILDFWSTWCSGCIASFGKAEELKKQFGDKLQVLFITPQSPEVINKFLASHRKISDSKPIIITQDKALQKFFPYISVPHLAWISPEGKVIQTTEAYDLTSENIDRLLKKQQVTFTAPKVDVLNFDPYKPLFDKGNLENTTYLYRSMITPFYPGLPGRIGTRKDSTTIRLFGLNQGLMNLYKKAWQVPLLQWGDNRVLFENLDRNKYEISNKYIEQQSKVWCYELIIPLSKQEQLYPMMQEDLTRFFNITGRIEEKEINCLILTINDRKIIPAAVKGERENNLADVDGKQKYLRNEWISTLVEEMNALRGMPLVLDETGIEHTLTMNLGSSITDIASLNRELAKYGLILKDEKRNTPMLILSPATTIKTPNAQN